MVTGTLGLFFVYEQIPVTGNVQRCMCNTVFVYQKHYDQSIVVSIVAILTIQGTHGNLKASKISMPV